MLKLIFANHKNKKQFKINNNKLTTDKKGKHKINITPKKP
jgi:hypothetical protein